MRYLGNKESIVSKIKEVISAKVDIQPGTVLFDAFCGGCKKSCVYEL